MSTETFCEALGITLTPSQLRILQQGEAQAIRTGHQVGKSHSARLLAEYREWKATNHQVCFTIPGPPVPKGRPRAFVRGGRVATYTPPETVAYENKVRLCAQLAINGRKGWPREKTTRYGIQCLVVREHARGDLDNFCKAIKDACNGIVWPDDRQVFEERNSMCNAKEEGGLPRVEVRVWVL